MASEVTDVNESLGQMEKSSADAVNEKAEPMDEAAASEQGSAGTEAGSGTQEQEDEGGTSAQAGGDSSPREMVDFKVVFNKQKYDVSFALDDTVASLKQHLETITSVPTAMQKVMFKGRMRDEATLRDHKVTRGSKIMLVGSTVTDVMSVSAPDPKVLKEEEKASAPTKEPLSKQKPHKTVLDKHGKPDDAMVGIKNQREPLPPQPISGMYNKHGGKVRLTFKMEQDQLWIGTKERTEKVPMASIKNVVSEPIDGHEDYHMLGIQLGPTEASRYWVYWVPAQFVEAVKDAILGKWQIF